MVNWDKVASAAESDFGGAVIYLNIFGHGDRVEVPVNEDLLAIEAVLNGDPATAVRRVRP